MRKESDFVSRVLNYAYNLPPNSPMYGFDMLLRIGNIGNVASKLEIEDEGRKY